MESKVALIIGKGILNLDARNAADTDYHSANRRIGLKLVQILVERGRTVVGTIRPQSRNDPFVENVNRPLIPRTWGLEAHSIITCGLTYH